MNHFVKPAQAASIADLLHWVDSETTIDLPLVESLRIRRHDRGSRGFFAKQIRRRLGRLTGGHVDVIDQAGSFRLSGDCKDRRDDRPTLAATVYVGDSEMYRRVMLGGTIGAAESYMAGHWSTDNLTDLIRIMIRNLDQFTRLESSWARIKTAWSFLQHSWRHNSVANSKRNIGEHYDLGNDFYRLFLDPTLSYSSGIFESTPGANASNDHVEVLHQASLRKMDAICDQLQLKPGEHVLEIGTGWGGMALHMAQRYGCRVTTTTISRQQFEVAQERVRQAGLQDRITILQQDYRELSGSYDKLVSIEMIEAVGHQYYDQYFATCNRLLRDTGAMLLQAITIGEDHYDHHIRNADFISKYIFPGGSLPSISALTRSVGKTSAMRMLCQADLTPHYVRTLEAWRIEFMNHLADVRQLGYDEAFIRRWHFYLCYCEAAFAERRVHCTHLMFAKPACNIDPFVRRSPPALDRRQRQPGQGCRTSLPRVSAT